jgi:ADP-ribose pyrophosphatase YjhB (NUDIX family)
MDSARLQEHINALIRLGYRFAYLTLRLWWFVRRPQTLGAAVALWHEGKVLLIRTSYRGCLSLPGGFVRSGEPSEQAARRELNEELGISIPPRMLRHAWHGMIPFESRQDTIDIWEMTVNPAPTPHVTGREIVWAGWVAPTEALKHPLLPQVAVYLDPSPAKMMPPGP